MANRFTLLILGLMASALFCAGCQTQQVAQNIPEPNFNGPSVAQQPVAPPPLPNVQQWNPPKPTPAPANPPQQATGIPRSWIPASRARPWQWSVIHHSATPAGSLALIDKEHKEKGWDGCGYHFVIGNGTNSGDGQVEPSARWPIQKWGAHAKTPDNKFNDYGIGICLVGNFDIDRPTAAQIQSLNKLVAYLMKTYHIPANRVLGHRETKPTDCPGRNMSVVAVRRAVNQMLADAGEPVAEDDQATVAASEELLLDQPTPR
jgi:N-acetylmuramoyl-L-alanine amidase-like protein